MSSEMHRLREEVGAARGASDRVVLEGFHPLKHAVRFGAAVEHVFLADPARLEALTRSHAPELVREIAALPHTVLERGELASLLTGRSRDAPDVIAIASRPRFDPAAVLRPDPDGHRLVLLEEPTHLGNVGAVVRVAAAASAAGVLTTGPHDPWHAAALRGSAGLHFALPVARIDRFQAALTDGRPLVAADPDGDARPQDIPPGAVLALGSERRGLSDALLSRADLRVRIPMRSGVSSLNLATAAAVLLYASASGQ